MPRNSIRINAAQEDSRSVDWIGVGQPDMDQWISPVDIAAAIRLLCETPGAFGDHDLSPNELRTLSAAAKILYKYGQET